MALQGLQNVPAWLLPVGAAKVPRGASHPARPSVAIDVALAAPQGKITPAWLARLRCQPQLLPCLLHLQHSSHVCDPLSPCSFQITVEMQTRKDSARSGERLDVSCRLGAFANLRGAFNLNAY